VLCASCAIVKLFLLILHEKKVLEQMKTNVLLLGFTNIIYCHMID